MKKIAAIAQPAKKREPMPTSSKVVMLVTAGLALLLVLFTFIDMAGYHLLVPELIPMGCVLVLLLLLTWLAMGIYRRRTTEHSKRIAMLVSALVIMVIGLFLSTSILQYAQLIMPMKYAVIDAPAGGKVAILSLVDNGFASRESTLEMLNRMQQRQNHIDALAAEAAGEPAPVFDENALPSAVVVDENGEMIVDENGVFTYNLDGYDYGAYGYVYCAYPVKLGIFYSSNALCDGLIYRGVESEAKLLSEWLDDETLSLYLENPEPGDSGSCKLSLHPIAAAAN